MAYGGDAGGEPGAGRGHNAPCSNRDFDFFYRGLEARQFLIQKCSGCGTLRNPPSPACGSCRSLEWEAVPLAGTGRVHSFVIHHYPPLPGFDVPHPIILADMDEGVRVLGAADGIATDAIDFDRPVAIEYLRRGDVAAFRFRPA